MCIHHWIIDPENKGKCLLCGGTHYFNPADITYERYLGRKPPDVLEFDGYDLDNDYRMEIEELGGIRWTG